MSDTNHNGVMGALSSATSAVFRFDGYGPAVMGEVTADDLESAPVYGHGDEKIGAIGTLGVAPDGMINHAVVDVGGFLGIGVHSVSVPFSDLTILREIDGEDVRVYLNATRETLKAMPAYTE